MRLSILIVVLFLTTIAYNAIGQEYYSAIADNGLLVFSEPTTKAKWVGKLACGEDLSSAANKRRTNKVH